MTTPPDPGSIDWTAVAAWTAGIATVLTSMGVAVWSAISKATKVAESGPPAITTREDTRIVTTDTVAMHELAGEVAALGMTAIEIRDMLKTEIAARSLDRAERDREEDKERLKREVMEDLRRENEMADRQRDDEPHRRPPRRPPG